MIDWIGQKLRVCLFYHWSVQVFVWVVWLWDGMNLRWCRIFPQILSPSTGAIVGDGIMKWRVKYIYMKNNRKGNSLKKIILQEIRWGIDGEKYCRDFRMWLLYLMLMFFKEGLIFIQRASRMWSFCLFFSV